MVTDLVDVWTREGVHGGTSVWFCLRIQGVTQNTNEKTVELSVFSELLDVTQ